MDAKDYFDSLGYPGTRDYRGFWDGGDTAAILGTVIALQPKQTFAPAMLNALVDDNGVPRRHYDVTKWYGQSDRCSRDQLIPLICAGIALVKHSTIDSIFKAHRRRGFLTAWNTKKNGAMNVPDKFPDITGPEIWALWIRYKEPWWGGMFLWILDLETLVGSISWRWFRKDRVCRNHMLVMMMSRHRMPSATMLLASLITDWLDLVSRWDEHCKAVGEYPTAEFFY